MSSASSRPREISARLLAPAIRYLDEIGIPAAPLLESATAPLDTFSNPDLRLPGDLLGDFLGIAVERTGDPAFGLHAGQRFQPGDAGLLEYLVRTSDTPTEVRERLEKYHRLAGDRPPRLEREGDRLVCGLDQDEGKALDLVLEEYNLSFWARLARSMRGDEHRPLEVRFTRPKPDHAEVAEDVFGAPVHYDCPRNGLIFSDVDQDRFGLPSDEGMRRAIGERADEALAALDGPEPFADRVRRQLRRQTNGDDLRSSTVARSLGVGERTLRRRLRDEGESFQAIRDGIRRERALEHLVSSRLSIGEIAYLLDFADATAFHRAFRRWTGETPAEYRRRAGRSDPGAG